MAAKSQLGVAYTVTVKAAGDASTAASSDGAYIILYGGKKGKRNSGRLRLRKGTVRQGGTIVFNVGVAENLSPLSSIDIGRDKGPLPGWFLNEVVVNCPSAHCEQTFRGSQQFTLNPVTKWSVTVYTADDYGAGTDANAFLVVYGKNAQGKSVKSEEERLHNGGNMFERSRSDVFEIETTAITKPYKVRVSHDNSGYPAGWKLDKIEMVNTTTKRRYTFPCDRWLANDKDDGATVRELPAEGEDIRKTQPVIKYVVKVYTGKQVGAGTDANVFITIYGHQGDTGERPLLRQNAFGRGSIDEFVVEAVRLKKLKKIRIRHDGTKAGSGWFLDRVVIYKQNDPSNATLFECNRWLDTKEDDGLIVRDIKAGGMLSVEESISANRYKVTVFTGDVRGAGTTANVCVSLFGDVGESGERRLDTATSDVFERGKKDEFIIESPALGTLNRLRIGHDNSGASPGWYLDKVIVDDLESNRVYEFPCRRWLAKDEDDGQISRDLLYGVGPDAASPGRLPYEITVWTGDVRGAGTDGNVFIQMFGENGKTEECALRNRAENFEKGQVDKFKIDAPDVGRLLKIRVRHDGKDAFTGWFLDKILIRRWPNKNPKHQRKTSKKHTENRENGDMQSKSAEIHGQDAGGKLIDSFEARYDRRGKVKPNEQHNDRRTELGRGKGGPTDKSRDDHHTTCTDGRHHQVPGRKQLSSSSSSADNESSDEERSPSGRDRLQQRSAERRDERKVADRSKDGGKKRHDDKDDGDRATRDLDDGVEEYWFACKRWFARDEDDGNMVRDLLPRSRKAASSCALQDLGIVKYDIAVFTGNEKGAGTNANVFITIYGDNGDTGKRALTQKFRDLFERNQQDNFQIEAVDLGALKKIRIEHDNSGFSSAWFLNRVEITNTANDHKWTFPCNRWLDKKKDDGKIARELLPR